MAVDDRNMDLRYLFSLGEDFRDRALEAYEKSLDVLTDRKRINLYHIVSAFDALARDLATGDEMRVANRQEWVDTSIRHLMHDLP